MKKIILAVVVLASSVAFADDASKHEGHMGEGMEMPGHQHKYMASMIKDWPAESRKAAEETIDKYGTPHEMTSSALIWKNVGSFKKTMVYKDAVDHQFPTPHKDVIAQVIDYKVPADKVDELAQFDGSLVFDRTRGELTARSDSEAHNIAMLNVADEVVNNKKSVSKARELLAKLIPGPGKIAEQPQLAERLQFVLVTQPTEDPDRPAARMGQ